MAVGTYIPLFEWHEEGCLVRNPFYQEPALDCWPCEDVRTMVDLSGLYNYSKAYLYNEKPFLVRVTSLLKLVLTGLWAGVLCPFDIDSSCGNGEYLLQDVMEKNFTLRDLQMIYKKHKIILEQGTAKFVSSHHALQTLNDVLNADNSLVQKNSINILWKINRVAAARVMRKIFHRPYFVPNSSEVALQRFLCISSSEAPQYFLPLTDFANVWMVQGQGYRLIVLDPSEPCAHNCSSVSVLLRPQDVLYYNWQFWRPRSLPARLSKDISITYIGSFY